MTKPQSHLASRMEVDQDRSRYRAHDSLPRDRNSLSYCRNVFADSCTQSLSSFLDHQGQCLVPGFDPRSYRAEEYGMIGRLLFLHHLYLYCGHLQLLPLHKIYRDNLGLITKVNKLLLFRLASTQAALHSKFDVLATIHDILKDFSLPPTISHIKGHQDNPKPYEDLSLPAQLNCDADVLATNELQNYPITCIHVPLLPPATVQITIGGTAVTRKLGPTIRRQHGRLGLLKAYMHERFRWTNDTVVSVNWEAFSCAFQSQY
jgi:hypothetical protein